MILFCQEIARGISFQKMISETGDLAKTPIWGDMTPLKMTHFFEILKPSKSLRLWKIVKKSERPVDALAENDNHSLTHPLTDNLKSRDASASKK